MLKLYKTVMLSYNRDKMKRGEAGYTLVELLICIVVLSALALGAFSLFTSLLHSAITAQRQAVASTLATNQMEYLKSLPYDRLAIAGGLIPSSNPLPATVTKKVEGVTYTVTSRIDYADDAYDGCGSYSPSSLKSTYCRSYPPPTGAPAVDNNPGDYKDVHVTVTDPSGTQLAVLDSQITALVAETSSNTGALFVHVVDGGGNPIEGATVTITNSSTLASPLSGTTDQNGIVIAYDLPPSTTGNKYVISASFSGYSSLTTIAPSSGLTPNASSQNLSSQSSANVTLTLYPMGANSLIVESTDTSGATLGGVKFYLKGGFKKYSSSTDTAYCYDNMTKMSASGDCTGTTTAQDNRQTTDSTTGLVSISNLVPGSYFFCGDAGATSCLKGSTTYYLAAAVPYGGLSPLEPIIVPTYDSSNPPSTTFDYGGVAFLQKVRLMMTSSSSFPRVTSLSPYNASLSGGTIDSTTFALKGANLCSSTCSSPQISLLQGATTYTATCSGSSTLLNCAVNLTGASVGNTQLVVKNGTNTLTLPDAPLLGGILVTP